MKKRLFFFLIFLFAGFLTPVFAENLSNHYYYKLENGNYNLCSGTSPGCVEIQPGADGASFANNRIMYQGISYGFSEYAQQLYNDTLTGTTRMFYYVDKNNKYVLCKTESSCKKYTFDELMEQNAFVTTKDRVVMNNGDGPGESGDIYYFNQTFQDKIDKGEDIGSSNNSGSIHIPPKEEIPPVTDNCQKLKEPLKFIGNVVLVVKILIPFLIILYGVVDFFRAITASKDDEIKKATHSLLMRAIAGVVIFFIPTIVSVVFSMISDFVAIKGDFNACQKCVLRVTECK